MSRYLVVALSLALSSGTACGGKKDCVGPGGVAMKDGDRVAAGDGCNDCFCKDGQLAYTIMQCAPIPEPEPRARAE